MLRGFGGQVAGQGSRISGGSGGSSLLPRCLRRVMIPRWSKCRWRFGGESTYDLLACTAQQVPELEPRQEHWTIAIGRGSSRSRSAPVLHANASSRTVR